MNWLKKGLQKAKSQISNRIQSLFGSGKKIAQEDLDAIEEILLSADLGPSTVVPLIDHLREASPKGVEYDQLLNYLETHIQALFQTDRHGLAQNQISPTVIMVVGVNGTGKTTTVAKLAKWIQNQGKSVLLASCDTFRAAATDQLDVWAKRLGVEAIQQGSGSDPAAVAFDALKAAQSRGMDYLICDTAGRLHNKANLMEELKKIARVLNKALPGSPHETLLVLDAVTGQNGFIQAEQFHKELNLTGVIVSKLDGTAKAGVVVSIEKDLKIPVKFVGVGESVDDLAAFSPNEFVKELLEVD